MGKGASPTGKVIILSTTAWFILFALQGAKVLGATVEPILGGIPFSLFYTFCMGIWGVINSFIIYKFWAPGFYERAEKVIAEMSRKGGE